MDDCAVINASPLILLSRSGHIDLLRHVARQVVVPQPVATEILVRGSEDPTVRVMNAHKWLRVVDSPGVPASVQEWGIGQGESSVIALASSIPRGTAVIDDLLGRRCAVAHGVAVRGTIGIVITAKEEGRIPLAYPVIQDLLQAGLYLSKRVLVKILARAGEAMP